MELFGEEWRKKAEEIEGASPLNAMGGAIMTDGELLQKDLPPVDWLFEKFLPKPALVALTGKPGSYKTMFAQWMAYRLADGKALFGAWESVDQFETTATHKQVTSLLVEEEMGEVQIQERLRVLRRPAAYEKVLWLVGFGVHVNEPETIEALKRNVVERGVELLIVDPFTTVSGMEDENDNSEARDVMDVLLKEFVNDGPKITVVFIHHPSKNGSGDSIRGAGDILGKTYLHYILEKVGGKNSRRIRVKCAKSRWKECEDFEMEFRQEGGEGSGGPWDFVYQGVVREGEEEGSPGPGRNPEHKEILSAFKRLMNPGIGYFQTDLAELVGRNRRGDAFKGALEMLKEDDTFYQEDGKWYKKVENLAE